MLSPTTGTSNVNNDKLITIDRHENIFYLDKFNAGIII